MITTKMKYGKIQGSCIKSAKGRDATWQGGITSKPCCVVFQNANRL